MAEQAQPRRIKTFEEWQELARKAPRRWIIYSTEDKPPFILSIFLGLQQYLIMFGATVSIPLLLGALIAQEYNIPPDVA